MSNGAISEETYKGLTIEIHSDESGGGDPRENDNLGTLFCSHARYVLGHEQFRESDFDGWDEVKEHLIKERGADVILPVYMMDHSGVSLRTSDYNDRWDSGMVGFVFTTEAKLKENFMTKNVTDEQRKTAAKVLSSEVETYGQWVNGEVYGYVIKRDDEEIASCWGYIGDTDYVMQEARAEADGIVAQAAKGGK